MTENEGFERADAEFEELKRSAEERADETAEVENELDGEEEDDDAAARE